MIRLAGYPSCQDARRPSAEAPADADAPPPTNWKVVETAGGPVTLAPLGDLRSGVTALTMWITQLSNRAWTVHADADRPFQLAGSILVARRSDWSPPTELELRVGQAAEMAEQVEAARQQDQAVGANFREEARTIRARRSECRTSGQEGPSAMPLVSASELKPASEIVRSPWNVCVTCP